jgi:hypothetical protein
MANFQHKWIQGVDKAHPVKVAANPVCFVFGCANIGLILNKQRIAGVNSNP